MVNEHQRHNNSRSHPHKKFKNKTDPQSDIILKLLYFFTKNENLTKKNKFDASSTEAYFQLKLNVWDSCILTVIFSKGKVKKFS